jgi:HK97 family phage major capsid protein
MKAGAITVEMPGQNFRIPKMTKDPEGLWKAELAEAPDTGVEFAAVEMRARTLMFWVEISRELAEDAVGLDAAIRNAMAQSAALEIDRAAIFGIGAGEQPMGLYVDADVTKVAATPGAYWDDISLSMKAIEDGNLTPSAVPMSPRTHHILRVLRDGEGRFQPVPEWCPPILVSKQISDVLGAGSNESIVVTGDFSNLIIGIRSAYHLEVLKEAKAQKYAIVLLAAVRLDTAIVRGEGFHILTGLTTAWG